MEADRAAGKGVALQDASHGSHAKGQRPGPDQDDFLFHFDSLPVIVID
jgi:hypothetical protein